jgi:hypothetical protein
MITLTKIRRVHLVGPRGSKRPINIAKRTLRVLAWTPDDPYVKHLPLITRILTE